MLDYVPKKVYLWGILLHYFIQKKSTAEAYRILLRFTAAMLCQKQHAKIGLDT